MVGAGFKDPDYPENDESRITTATEQLLAEMGERAQSIEFLDDVTHGIVIELEQNGIEVAAQPLVDRITQYSEDSDQPVDVDERVSSYILWHLSNVRAVLDQAKGRQEVLDRKDAAATVRSERYRYQLERRDRLVRRAFRMLFDSDEAVVSPDTIETVVTGLVTDAE